MEPPPKLRPRGLLIWELLAIGLAVAILLVFSIAGKGRRERAAYQRFLERAPVIQAALERYAADNKGHFPPDGSFTNPPPGLDETYIKWDPQWKVDYDVHPNGKGGMYVCMEFCGPYKERWYFGLCNNPEYRRNYGRGQAIPGKYNRIWVVREQAPIMPQSNQQHK
jgi:hypothetical protein